LILIDKKLKDLTKILFVSSENL